MEGGHYLCFLQPQETGDLLTVPLRCLPHNSEGGLGNITSCDWAMAACLGGEGRRQLGNSHARDRVAVAPAIEEAGAMLVPV